MHFAYYDGWITLGTCIQVDPNRRFERGWVLRGDRGRLAEEIHPDIAGLREDAWRVGGAEGAEIITIITVITVAWRGITMLRGVAEYNLITVGRGMLRVYLRWHLVLVVMKHLWGLKLKDLK